MVPLKIVSNVSRFKPALNFNRVLADLSRYSNSLNSVSDQVLIPRFSAWGQKEIFCASKINLSLSIIILHNLATHSLYMGELLYTRLCGKHESELNQEYLFSFLSLLFTYLWDLVISNFDVRAFFISEPSSKLSRKRGKAGGHKPQHFPIPCHILAFLSSGSHKPKPFGLQYRKTKKLMCGMEGKVVGYCHLPTPPPLI